MSWKNYNWVLPQVKNKEDGVSRRILANRFGEDFDIDDFLAADFKLYDPFLMQDMARAVGRIKKAIDNNEKIIVFGDYDADGVTAAAVLSEFFSFIGKEIDVYIPDRYKEGYGLKLSSLMQLKEGGADLVITVDCGIRACDVIDKASERGLDVIVTDHHNVGDKIPDCSAVVNPKRKKSSYPEREIAGVGVAFALVRALLDEMNIDPIRAEWFIKWNLDLVAIGTIADMVPMVGENRIVVKYGLMVLNRMKRVGVRKLLAMSGKNFNEITAREVGYVIAPRINSAGRIDHAIKAYNLLTEKDELEAEFLAKSLVNSNNKRQELTNSIILQTYDRIDALRLPDGIFLANKDWPCGVVGLVSSRLTEKFNRPSFIGEIKDGKVKGSVRSINGINIVKVLDAAQDLLDYYGGHDMAAGYTMPLSNWKEFQKKVLSLLNEKMKNIDTRQRLIIDDVIENNLLNMSLWQDIKGLRPFGVSNQEPVFMLSRLKLSSKKVIGRDMDHIKLIFNGNNKNIEGLWWRHARFNDKFKLEKSYDVAGLVEVNEFRGNQNVYLNVIDVRECS